MPRRRLARAVSPRGAPFSAPERCARRPVCRPVAAGPSPCPCLSACLDWALPRPSRAPPCTRTRRVAEGAIIQSPPRGRSVIREPLVKGCFAKIFLRKFQALDNCLRSLLPLILTVTVPEEYHFFFRRLFCSLALDVNEVAVFGVIKVQLLV